MISLIAKEWAVFFESQLITILLLMQNLNNGGDAMNKNSIPNRLIDEKSPYLLQHAYNPVNWFPWGSEAFDKAKHENKPIFLSIGYS